MADVTNPGSVNVADEAFGLGVAAYIASTYVTTPGPAVNATAGGSFDPGNSNITNTTENNVAGQVYGTGSPINVYV